MYPPSLSFIAGSVAASLGFITIGYKYVAVPIFALKSILVAVTVWQVLSALSPILAPLLTLVLIFLGRVLWNHEKRIRNLEEGKTRQSRTIYGDEKDPTQTGLAQDIKSIKDRLDSIEEHLR